LLDAVLDAYPLPHLVSKTATLIRTRLSGDQARVDKANRAEIHALMAQADDASDGLTIQYHLSKAASLARQFGVRDLERDATTRLQAAPSPDYATLTGGWFASPGYQVAEFMRPFRDAPTWRHALAAWLITDSPAGSYDANQRVVRMAFETSVFSRLLTRISFGSLDLPRKVRTGDEDALAAELIDHESFRIAIRGRLLGNALDLIAHRFGIPSHDELTAFLGVYGCRPQWAGVLATALRLYWVGEFTASAHLAVPKVEAAARALLLELNEPVYRSYVADSPGQFGGLGALLEPLVDNGFDQDWARFLSTLLLGDGNNVRNTIAHGFTDDVDRDTAALVLRAAAVLITITAADPAARDRATAIAALQHPTGQPRPRPLIQRVRSAVHAAIGELRR
jgi:hypothetical protein